VKAASCCSCLVLLCAFIPASGPPDGIENPESGGTGFAAL